MMINAQLVKEIADDLRYFAKYCPALSEETIKLELYESYPELTPKELRAHYDRAKLELSVKKHNT